MKLTEQISRIPCLKKSLCFLGVCALILLAPFFISHSLAQKPLNLYQLPLEGLSDVEVTSIYQDHYGFLWFGTANGLNRFDGKEYIPFTHEDTRENSISSNQINTILEDKQNQLWVGSKYGLNRLDRNTRTFKRYMPESTNSNSIPGKNIKVLFLDSKGNLWVGSNNGLSKYDPELDQFKNYYHKEDDPNSLSGNSVNQIIEDSKGRLWIGTNYSGVSLFKPEEGTFSNFKHDPNDPNSLSGNTIISLFEDSYKNLWIGTIKNGLNRFDENTNTFKHYTQGAHRGSLATNSVYSITENMDRNLVIGGMQGGMSIYNRKTDTFVRYNTKGQINLKGNTASVLTDFITKDNQILIATSNGGVNIYDNHPSNFSTFRQDQKNENSLSIDHITAVLSDENGRIWIGTNGGGLNEFSPERETFKHFLKSNKKGALMDNTILSIAMIKGSNQLLLNTQMNGLVVFDIKNQEFTPINLPISEQNLEISSVLVDDKNAIWFTTSYRLLKLNDINAVPEEIINLKEESQDSFSSLILDQKGHIWAACQKGIYQINGNELNQQQFYPFPNTKNQNIKSPIISMAEDTKGNIWLTTKETGIWKLYNGAFRKINAPLLESQLISNFFFRNDDLWMTADKNLYKAHLKGDSIAIQKTYTSADGLPGNIFSKGAIAQSQNGNYLLGSLGGLSTFHPDSLLSNPHIPPIAFTDLYIDNKKIDQGTKDILEKEINQTDKITLPQGSNDFSISFASLNYIKPEKNQFAYRLEGYDKDWIYGHDSKASYVDLPPGIYTFKVKGSNNDGLWNQKGKTIKIEVQHNGFNLGSPLGLTALILIGAGVVFFIRKNKWTKAQHTSTPSKTDDTITLPPQAETKDTEETEDFLEKIKDIVLSNLQNEAFDVNMLCKEIGTSRTQLYRKFKEYNGETVSSYIREIKLDRARQLLSKGDLSIAEVHQLSGFKSASHFSKSFQSKYGKTPSDFLTFHKTKNSNSLKTHPELP
ncbi:helix-turn-helix domain-containing protein [Echinicola marina]|uniref:two-component regulator propeller domain-containing protein n=1 Tax=Echinicola marina TaxID=2859768 RepID=UPI001CF6074F|nr:two-component regulator propeller domain-containing protein [Echinicola marina]UCS93905.1 helix-turn-helix domain-containing protein [Echinicola marina]